HVASLAIGVASSSEVRLERALGQQTVHGALYERVRGQVACVLGRDEFFKHWRVGYQPAESQTSGDELGECAEMNDISGVVLGLERRRRRAIEMNEASRVVFHNRQVIGCRDF